ncbi:MAG TPA: prohead protease/major capsid protein fusion protein [Stellaceae bacterium]|nr:prohead protease/major capsid protein fusion protein [Stellaceae bacterium]
MLENTLSLRHSTDALLTRSVGLSPASLNREARTVTATLVSRENAVQRRDASGRTYRETLSTEADSFSLHSGDRLPLLDSHRRGSIADILGYVTDIRSENGAVVGTVHVTDDRTLTLIEVGALSGISIGFKPDPNAWRISGDTRTAGRYTIHEASLVASPADPGATLRHDNPTPDDPIQTRAAINQEIRTLCRAANVPATFADGLIDRGLDVQSARASLFDEITRRGSQNLPAVQLGLSGDDPNVLRTRASIGLSYRLGLAGDCPAESREFAAMGLHQTLRMMLSARNEPGVWTAPVADLIERAITTGDLPGLLQDSTHRLLLPAYQAAQSPVRQLFRQSSATDFRDQHRVRISEAPALEKVEEHAEITLGGFQESDESYKLATYARIVSVTFQALQNDDLGSFGRTATAMGQAAAQTENGLLIALLTANAGAGPALSDGHNLFHANHGNAASAGGAIADATLTAAFLAMRQQKGLDGTTPLNLAPRYMLVPAALEITAQKELSEVRAAAVADVNVFSGRLTLLTDARLDAISATRWYLAGDPVAVPCLEYAYLSGREGPQVDTRAGWSVLGTETRVVLSFGAGAIDYRGLYTNAGA